MPWASPYGFAVFYRIYASSESSNKPVHSHTLARAFTVQTTFADPESFVGAGVQLKSDNVFFVFVFLVDEGREDPKYH